MHLNKILALVLAALFLANCGGSKPETKGNQDSGKASGTISIDGKPENLTYAYARRMPSLSKSSEHLAIVLTNKPVAEKDMPALLEKFEATAEQQDFLSDKNINGLVFIVSKRVMPAIGVPYEGHVIKAGRAYFAAREYLKEFSMRKGVIRGKAQKEEAGSKAEIEYATDDGKKFTYKYDIEFETLAQGETLLTEREGAVSPDIGYRLSQPGKAEGTFTFDGKTIKLTYAYAIRQREFFDEPEETIMILATDQSLSEDAVRQFFYKDTESTKATKLSREAVLGVLLTILPNTSKSFDVGLRYKTAKFGTLGTGSAAEELSISKERVTAKTSNTQEGLGHKWSYAVSVEVSFGG